MEFPEFELERVQSRWENTVTFNLTETGIQPLTVEELLEPAEIRALLSLPLGYGYTPGTPELRSAVASTYDDCTPDNILVTTGAAEANLVALLTLMERGDELLLQYPNYLQIHGLARVLGIRVVPFHLEEERGWQPDVQKLSRLVTRRTRMIALCNPNNPTGAVLSKDNAEELVRLAERSGAWLYVDEVYRGAEYSGPETPSLFGRGARVLVAGGLSKAWSLPGLRVGWLAGPREVVEAAMVRRDYTTIATARLSNDLAARALEPARRQRIRERNRAILQTNLAALQTAVNGCGGGVSFVPPRAGAMVLLRTAAAVDSAALAERIRKEQDVLVAGGHLFGLEHCLRVGMGNHPAEFKTALTRLFSVLRSL